MRSAFVQRSWRVVAVALTAVLAVIAMPLVASNAAYAGKHKAADSAELTIKKVVEGDGADLDKAFKFNANFQQLDEQGKGAGIPSFDLSDDTDKTFTISTKLAGNPGISENQSDKDYALDRVVCESDQGSVIDVENGNKDVNLKNIVAGDEITCTFYNKFTGEAPEVKTDPTPEAATAEAKSGAQTQSIPSKNYSLTLVARECDNYTDVFANRARNDIMETLEDLGPNSNYNSSMNPSVHPSKEAVNPQANCRPITDWTFSMGSGMTGGTPANPSIVSGKFAGAKGSAKTLASVPQRKDDGSIDGTATVAGAVTVDLGDENPADESSKYWVQGGKDKKGPIAAPYVAGTSGLQLNQDEFGDKYSFAALRCSVDALNGDNVEWAEWKSGVKHQYCYAYYVNQPPKVGEIKITKNTVGGPAQPGAFDFTGNISYNPGGAFSLNSGATQTFEREAIESGQTPWETTESAKANWNLTDLVCTKDRRGSQVNFDRDSGKFSVTKLADGGKVHCTYTNTYVPNPGKITLKKEVSGAGANQDLAFGFTGSGLATGQSASLKHNATKEFSLAPFSNGNWVLTENDLPADWSLADISCTSNDRSNFAIDQAARKITVSKLSENGTVSCTYKNQYTQPTAEVTVKKLVTGVNADQNKAFGFTSDATGISGFALKHNGTKTFTVPTTQNGKYIAEAAPDAKWNLADATCTAGKFDRDGNKVILKDLQKGDKIECVFTNNYTPAAASLTVNKSVTGINASTTQNFDFAGDAGAFVLNGGDNKSKSGIALPVGGSFAAHEVWENLPAGWTGATPKCVSTNGTDISYDGGKFTLNQIKEGDKVTCDYVNTYTPAPVTVNVSKQVTGINADVNQEFPFTQSGGDGFGLAQSSDAKSITVPVTASDWSVSEGDMPNDRWSFTNVVCKNGTQTVGSITGKTAGLSATQLAGLAGKTVNCVYTNTYSPAPVTVNVSKKVAGINADVNQKFPFTDSTSEAGFELAQSSAAKSITVPVTNNAWTVAEGDLPARWNFTNAVCKVGDETIAGGKSTTLSAEQLAQFEGKTVDCVYTNTYSPADVTVNIAKKVAGINADVNQEFPFTQSGGDGFGLAQSSDAKSIAVPVTASDWSVSEGDMPNDRWSFTNAVCKVGTQTVGSVTGKTAGFSATELAELEGKTVNCVYTNTYSPADVTVNVSKKVAGINADADQLFPFTDSTSEAGFNLAQSSDAKSIAVPVTANAWTVAEGDLPARWDFTNAVCSADGQVINGAGGKTSTLSAAQLAQFEGKTVNCVYTNTYTPADAQVVIVKGVEGINASTDQDFDFSGTGGDFQLNGGDNNTTTFPLSNIGGTFNASEDVEGLPANWAAGLTKCESTKGTQVEAGNGSFALSDIKEGDSVTCTFTNTYSPAPVTVNVSKQVSGINADADQLFPFTDSTSEAGFNLAQSSEAKSITVPVTANDWTVAEGDLPPRWDFTNAVCSADGQEINGAGGKTSTLSAAQLAQLEGKTVNCVYTNSYIPAPVTVNVSKQVAGINADADQLFPFTDSTSEAGFELAQSSDAKSITVPVTANDWTVAEGDLPERWDFTNAICKVGDAELEIVDGNVATLSAEKLAELEGKTVNCVYTNTYSPADVTVNVAKQVEGINADADQEFPFADSTEHGFDLSQNSDAEAISVPVTANDWSVTEGDMPSDQWEFTDAKCTVGEDDLEGVGGQTTTLTAAQLAQLEGKTVNCVYTNTYTPADVTVNITKHVEGVGAPTEAFKFGTNMNEEGSFNIAGGDTETFKLKVVEGDVNFTAHEDIASLNTGWNFSGLKCESDAEGTAVNANEANGQLAITSVSDGATVNCEYTNTFTPAPPTESPSGPTEPAVTPTDGPVDPSNSDDPAVTPTTDDGGNPGEDGLLAQTGAVLGLAVLIGMIALVTGTMMVLTTRRRARKH